MNILITGIHGFVGSNLVKQLSKNHQVYGLDITFPEKEGIIKICSWADLGGSAMPDVDVIIHLAGKAHDTKNYTDAPVYFEVNTGLTKKIFDYFMHSGTRKFIFFSSVKAVADTVDGYELTEDEPPHPKGPYAESKRKAEEYIIDKFPFLAVSSQQSAVSETELTTHYSLLTTEPGTRNQEQGTRNKSVYILRPCMIHGPGNKGNLNLLYKVVKKGIPWPLGAFNNRRSFTSIDNLNFIIEQLIENDILSGIYNMADDEAVSTNELIGIIHEALSGQHSALSSQHSENRTGKREPRTKHLIWNIPKPVIRAIASLGTLLHLPLNKDRLQKLTKDYMVSNEKIKVAIGIKSMPVKAGDGLRRTVESFEE